MSANLAHQYWCNLCRHTVTPTPHPDTSALICPNCTSTLVGELQNPNPTNQPRNDFDLFQLVYAASVNPSDGVEGFGSRAAALLEYIRMSIANFDSRNSNRNGSPPTARAVVEALPSLRISEEMLGRGVSECAICTNIFDVGDVGKELPCKHIYHSDCVLPWLSLHNTCPICRFQLPTDDVDYENRRRGASGEGRYGRDGNRGSGNENVGGSNEDID